MNQKQERAIDIYKKLGYEDRPYEEINQLGTGTKEEKKIAKEGLQRGEWWEFREIEKNTYGSVNIMGVDLSKLAIFAIKVGVDARRTANILDKNTKVCLEAVMERGENFALQLIEAVCRADRRPSEHSSSRFGSLAVQLVHLMNLEIPDNLDYLKDWTHFAAGAFELIQFTTYERGNELIPSPDMVKSRFKEHIIKGVHLSCPSTGPFSLVFSQAVKDGVLSEDEAKDLIFLALDMASRPGDRKEWMSLLEEIGYEREDITERKESLIPLLAYGETALTERIAPHLIAEAKEEELGAILISAFSVKAKKTKIALLKLALEREINNPSPELIEWLTFINNTDDKTLLSLIHKLSSKWKMELKQEEEEVEIQGLWQACPPVWDLPRFETGEVSSDALTSLAALISERSDVIPDIELEAFLKMANDMARNHPSEAKLCLAGMRNRNMEVTTPLLNWARNKEYKSAVDRYFKNYRLNVDELHYADLISARNKTIVNHIGSLPCILSSPTYVDLSLDLKTLVSHLESYQEAGLNYVYEPDLQLALTRLDVTSETKEDLRALEKIKLNIKLPDEELLTDEESQPLSATEVILNYLRDPYIEPELDLKEASFYHREVSLPKSLRDFPYRLSYNSHHYYSIFPLWGDYALFAVRRDREVYHGQGLVLRQVARRKNPLGGGAIVNLLAAQSYVNGENAADVILAAKEAWERGLLPPSKANAARLDWTDAEPSGLSSLAKALDDIAKDGLLSLVWPILDELIALALKKNRIPSGTAELAKTMNNHLSEVLYALKQGLADEKVLELKGLRRLADKTGSSSAVTTAKEIIKQLASLGDRGEKKEKATKKETRETTKVLPEISFPSLPFEEVWAGLPKPMPHIEDGAELSIEVLETKRSVKPYVFILTLPAREEVKYISILESWFYSLDSEGQLHAIEIAKDEEHTAENLAKKGRQVWLHWDEEEGSLTVSPHRNWRQAKDGPLDGTKTPLSSTLLTIILAILSQDGDAIYYGPSLVKRFINSGELNEGALRELIPRLLQYDALSPAKLVRALEKDPTLLPLFRLILMGAIARAESLTRAEGRIPVWLNRVLDISIYYSQYLKEALKRGLIEEGDLAKEELIALRDTKAKSTAKAKAGHLIELLEI